jgi:hypothetical protein
VEVTKRLEPSMERVAWRLGERTAHNLRNAEQVPKIGNAEADPI